MLGAAAPHTGGRLVSPATTATAVLLRALGDVGSVTSTTRSLRVPVEVPAGTVTCRLTVAVAPASIITVAGTLRGHGSDELTCSSYVEVAVDALVTSMLISASLP